MKVLQAKVSKSASAFSNYCRLCREPAVELRENSIKRTARAQESGVGLAPFRYEKFTNVGDFDLADCGSSTDVISDLLLSKNHIDLSHWIAARSSLVVTPSSIVLISKRTKFGSALSAGFIGGLFLIS